MPGSQFIYILIQSEDFDITLNINDNLKIVANLEWRKIAYLKTVSE